MTKTERIDLGISIAHCRHRGKALTVETIAAYAGCSKQRIEQIQAQALQKVRKALRQQGVEEALRQELGEALKIIPFTEKSSTFQGVAHGRCSSSVL